LVTSLRHFESLSQTKNSLDQVINGINSGISNNLLALDIRHALNHLGEIKGEITTEDLLENIFSKFCIGKFQINCIPLILPESITHEDHLNPPGLAKIPKHYYF